jgi:hypothetical protein
MQIESRRGAVVVGVILSAVGVLGLSACAPDAPAPTTSSTSASGATASAAPSSTPTPTAVAIAPPQVRVPLTCDQVAPIAEVNAALGTNVVAATPDPSDLTPYAYLQDGALYCSYVGTVAKSESEYQLLVMPDITLAQWNKDKKYLDGSTPSPFGANSFLDCESSPKDLKCNLDILIGTTWITIQDFSDNVTATLTEAQALSRFQPVLQTAITAVKGATIAEPLWKDPDATAVNIAPSNAFENLLKHASGVDYATDVYNPDPVAVGPQSEAMYPTGFQIFGGGGGKYSITTEVLPGGSWAFSRLTSAVAGVAEPTPLSGLGDQAFSFGDPNKYQPYDTQILATQGHNLISIDVDTSSKTAGPNVPTVAKNVAAAVLTQIN